MTMILLERWQKFSKRDQIGHIASEILRAKLIKSKDYSAFLQMIEQAIYLIDLSLGDEKWKENPLPLLVLRNELAEVYIGETKDLGKLYAAL